MPCRACSAIAAFCSVAGSILLLIAVYVRCVNDHPFSLASILATRTHMNFGSSVTDYAFSMSMVYVSSCELREAQTVVNGKRWHNGAV